ncbi:methyl-accepting chemotaxis protein [Halobiforma haloterrestris]|uniref:Methyl-accepting chemotaxis protein n=1 Tax=Natronobacterium haloterrestre TaxID=148448 RepID=A0A1I1D014_NATHA|nr:FIST N-terminal domain-containing protein [Halobiforma haloterrestris]SFB68107.1 methyl-accepting chemotaxis protein [Halobiforma haloterrestris]
MEWVFGSSSAASAFRFGVLSVGIAAAVVGAGFLAGLPGLLGGGALIVVVGTVLGHWSSSHIDSTLERIETEARPGDAEAVGYEFDAMNDATDLGDALESTLKENRRLRERTSELEEEIDSLEARNERIEAQAADLEEAMGLCAAGRLAHRIEPDEDAPLDVAEEFNAMMDELEGTIRQLKDFVALVVTSSDELLAGTDEVTAASTEISDDIQEIADGSSVQSERLEAVNAEMDVLSSNIEEIASRSERVASLSAETVETGHKGREAARTAIDGLEEIETGSAEAVEAIETLNEDVEAIDELVELIADIAHQTNMLALNANIEASRGSGGDDGEGFAVVASEVKDLASEVQSAAERIETRLERIQERTASATQTVTETEAMIADHTDSVEHALAALEEIAEYAEGTNDGVQEIHAAADQQAESTQQVVALVDETATISERTSGLAANVAASAEEQTSALSSVSDGAAELAENAAWLRDTLDMYKARAEVPGHERTLPDSEDGDAAAAAAAADADVATATAASTAGDEREADGEPAARDGNADAAGETAFEFTDVDDDGLSTQFASGVADGDDGFTVGKEAATRAAEGLETDGRVDFGQVFCSPEYDYEAVLSGIRSVVGDDVELIGSSSSGEFTEGTSTEGSVTVALVASDSIRFFSGIGTDLSAGVAAAVNEAVDGLPASVEGYPHRSAIVLHDGLAGVGDQVAVATQRNLGRDVSFVGGSAGDDLAMDATHVFRNDTVASDAVVVGMLASTEPVTISVDHGHSPISEPLTVTNSEGGRVLELDGKPAFEAWREVVEPYLAERGREVDVEGLEDGSLELLGLLTEFEFGIEEGRGASDDGYKIRWPGLSLTTAGYLDFPVGVPEGTELRVMHSPKPEQIESARDTAREAVENTGSSGVAGGFVYDCACRSIILEDEFGEAVDAMADELEVPFTGIETYGELCMERGQLSGFHNTTSVVMLLPE